MKNKIIIENCLVLPLTDSDQMQEILMQLNMIVAILLDGQESPLSTKHFFVYKGGHHYAVHQIIDGKVQQERIIFYEF